jgi:hypothetical protein
MSTGYPVSVTWQSSLTPAFLPTEGGLSGDVSGAVRFVRFLRCLYRRPFDAALTLIAIRDKRSFIFPTFCLLARANHVAHRHLSKE